MKVAVYAIAKNEEKHAARWADSASEADYRIVLDTGSSDKTVDLLSQKGVTVFSKKIDPWRFDIARNASLALVPEDVDVCIALDLDEVLLPGWRAALERAWQPTTTMLRYPFVSTWKEGLPDTISYGFRIHKRGAYTWQYAIHELLIPKAAHREVFSDELEIHQYQDQQKDRGYYIPTLKKLVAAEPNVPRYRMYLGRHHFDDGKYTEAIEDMYFFLSLPGSIDPQERAFAYRVIAWSHVYLGHNPSFAIEALLHAVAESPNEREVWVHLAETMANIGNWPNCLAASANALAQKDRSKSYIIDSKSWGTLPLELFEKSARSLGISETQLAVFRNNLTKNGLRKA